MGAEANPLESALARVRAGRDLERAEARAVLGAVFAAEAPDEALLADLLTALRDKGEAVGELVGFAEAMRAAVADIGLGPAHAGRCVDTCGTGGSARHGINISTAAALAVAAAGLPVAKHGNRTNASVCGSADVLEAVGVELEVPAARLGPCLREVGFAFLYAPRLHPAMKAVAPVRKRLPFRTIFNLLGPLTNPAGARFQVIGVPHAGLVPKMAEALAALGTERSFVVASRDGLGEFSTAADNDVAEVRHGAVRRFVLTAAEVGLAAAGPGDLHCADRAAAVAGFRRVLAGERGPHQDIVCFNAAAALVAGGRAESWREGIAMARAALERGEAQAVLERLVAYTRAAGGGRTEAAGRP